MTIRNREKCKAGKAGRGETCAEPSASSSDVRESSSAIVAFTPSSCVFTASMISSLAASISSYAFRSLSSSAFRSCTCASSTRTCSRRKSFSDFPLY